MMNINLHITNIKYALFQKAWEFNTNGCNCYKSFGCVKYKYSFGSDDVLFYVLSSGDWLLIEKYPYMDIKIKLCGDIMMGDRIV